MRDGAAAAAPRRALGEDGARAAAKRHGPRRALAHAGASARGIVRRSHRRQYVRSSTTRTALIVVAIRAAAVGAVAGAVGAVARARAGENFRGVALLPPLEPERISGLQCLQVASFGSLGLTQICNSEHIGFPKGANDYTTRQSTRTSRDRMEPTRRRHNQEWFCPREHVHPGGFKRNRGFTED